MRHPLDSDEDETAQSQAEFEERVEKFWDGVNEAEEHLRHLAHEANNLGLSTAEKLVEAAWKKLEESLW